MRLKQGQIILTYKQFMRTRNIEVEEYHCGHYVLPISTKKHLEDVYCPVCKKKTMAIGRNIIEESK